MGRWLCLVGRHDWKHQRNPEVSGPAAEYDSCGRCGKERAGYDKPPPSGVARG